MENKKQTKITMGKEQKSEGRTCKIVCHKES